jgi:hypothetical protein
LEPPFLFFSHLNENIKTSVALGTTHGVLLLASPSDRSDAGRGDGPRDGKKALRVRAPQFPFGVPRL